MNLPPLALACATSLLALGCDRSPARAPVVVFAASSLTEAFEEIERDYERDHPGVDVQLTFAGSQVLRLQLEQGARADIFASAHPEHIRALEAADLVQGAKVFAQNDLIVITPPRDDRLTTLGDLGGAARVILGTPSVPVGRYADEVLARANLSGVRVASREANTRLVRAKVEMGEADAALVYRTDASPKVRVVEIPARQNIVAKYHIATTSSARPHTATFLRHVLGRRGARALARRGFSPPEAP